MIKNSVAPSLSHDSRLFAAIVFTVNRLVGGNEKAGQA